MGDKDSRGFGFGDRRQVERGDAHSVQRSSGSGIGSYGGHADSGLAHDVDASEDEQFLGRIHRALQRDPRIPEGIQIAVHAGQITLSGSVRSENAKRVAAEAVQALPGVREVINDIQVII